MSPLQVGDRALATEEILGGAGLGALGGFFLNRKKANVLVVYPDQDLAVKLSLFCHSPKTFAIAEF